MPARNAPLDPAYQHQIKASYPELRRQARERPNGIFFPINEHSQQSAMAVTEAQRQREYEAQWAHGGYSICSAFADLLTDKTANDTAAEFVRAKIHEIVRDPAVACALSPTSHPLGTKRPCVDIGYYATYNRDNVTLVDIRRTPIEAVTPHGIRTRDAEYELDSIVFATGFDAITGALRDIDIRGRDGVPLAKHWADGPRTYLGIAAAGFPNLFLITGPGSPSVLSNMVPSIELHVDWIAGCLRHLRAHGFDRIEPTVAAEDEWTTHVAQLAESTLYPTVDSYFLGSNVPGKPRVFMPYTGGAPAYRQRCDAAAAAGYEGFTLTASANQASAEPD
jgi:cyclohexanone monooxygenase